MFRCSYQTTLSRHASVLIISSAVLFGSCRGEKTDSPSSRLDALFGGRNTVEELITADGVEVYLINDVDFDALPTRVDDYAITEGPVRADAKQRGELAGVLASADTYGWGYDNSCVPAFGVMMRFKKEDREVFLILCLACDYLAVIKDGKMIGGEEFDEGRPAIIRVLKELFPENKIIQGQKE